jgi:Protein of unknown function (DUF3592)
MEQYIDLKFLYLALVILLAFFIAFAFGTVKVFDIFASSIFAAKWPVIIGKIEEVSWQEHEVSTRNNSKEINYQVIVKYKYSVNARTYTNDTIAFGYGSSENIELP